MSKLKTVLSSIESRMKHAESRSEQLFLTELHSFMFDTIESLKKGE
jgi:hypothetical protein